MLEQVLTKARGLRIPNHALRRLIAAVAPSAVAASVPSEGPAQGRQEAAAAAAIQSSSSVPVLLRLAKFGAAGRTESGNAAVQLRHAAARDEAAVWAFLLLTLDGDDACVGLVTDGAIDALFAVAARSARSRPQRSPASPPLISTNAASGHTPSVIAMESQMHAGCRKTRKIKRRYAGCRICPR